MGVVLTPALFYAYQKLKLHDREYPPGFSDYADYLLENYGMNRAVLKKAWTDYAEHVLGIANPGATDDTAKGYFAERGLLKTTTASFGLAVAFE